MTAPAYLADSLRLTSDVAARRRLRSVNSPTMLVPSNRRSTLVTARFLCCSAGVEQSATTDQGRLLATDNSAGDQVSSFPLVIWLTEIWRSPC